MKMGAWTFWKFVCISSIALWNPNSNCISPTLLSRSKASIVYGPLLLLDILLYAHSVFFSIWHIIEDIGKLFMTQTENYWTVGNRINFVVGYITSMQNCKAVHPTCPYANLNQFNYLSANYGLKIRMLTLILANGNWSVQLLSAHYGIEIRNLPHDYKWAISGIDPSACSFFLEMNGRRVAEFFYCKGYKTKTKTKYN
jgi:hypothetical protein